jgi:ankyrin repeat protein
MTGECDAAYDQDVITAVREGDIDTLREMHENGRPLQCSNKFGESLIHMACRRGLTDVVRFLIKEAGVTLRVKDDVGRSPLHDAFWSSEPNFDLLDLLIEHDADLLLVQDNRGDLPIKYARQNQWDAWRSYLLNRREVICLNTFMDSINDEVIG